MKKLLVIFLAAAFPAVTAHAEDLKKKDLAELIFPMIENCNWEDVQIKDVKNPSRAVLAAVSCGLESIAETGEFAPESAVTNFEFTECLVKTWEMRFGGLSGAALGGDFSDYSDLGKYEKSILDKGTMLGIVKNGDKFLKDNVMQKADAEELCNRLFNNAVVMKRYKMDREVTAFRDDRGITGEAKCGKIYFYKTFNTPCGHDTAALVAAVYDGGVLKDVAYKSYSGLCENDFTIMHVSVSVPEESGDYSVKAFVFDCIDTMKPIYDYRLID